MLDHERSPHRYMMGIEESEIERWEMERKGEGCRVKKKK